MEYKRPGLGHINPKKGIKANFIKPLLAQVDSPNSIYANEGHRSHCRYTA